VIYPGEIYFLSAAAGARPVIVVSREELNRGNYVTAVPCTSQKFAVRSKLPNCVPFVAGQFGFSVDCVAQCEYILAIRKADIDFSMGLIGTLDDATLRDVGKAIGYVIECDCE